MPAANCSTRNPQTLLVVEDDDLICKLLRVMFDHQGIKLDFVGTYQAAVAVIDSSKPRMLILDLGLPDGDGLDLLQHFREDLGRSEPVLVLTAFRAEEKAAIAFEHGADDFVTKPFSPKELSHRVASALAS